MRYNRKFALPSWNQLNEAPIQVIITLARKPLALVHHPTRMLTFGFAIVILLMIALAIVGFRSINGQGAASNQTIALQLQKITLINELATIVQNRNRFMQSMLLRDKDFIESESWPDFSRMNGAYAATRERLGPLLAPREREIMQSIDTLEQNIDDLNRQVAVLFLNGSRDEASKVLLTEVLPKTASLLENLSQLTQLQRMDVEQAMLQSSQNAEHSRSQITLFSIVAVLISLTVTFIAIWYGRKLSRQLQDMNTYLEQKIYERTESLLDTQKELLEDNSELTRMALTDNLTGLSNRTHMNQILHKEFSRFERHNQRFGIIMLDIDHFKNINDKYGHDAGDTVLKRLAATFESAIRTSDFRAGKYR